MIFYKKLATLIPLLPCFNAQAQDTIRFSGNFPPPNKPLSAYATKALGAINLDGKLTENDWTNAADIFQFVQVEPYQGEKPTYITIVKVLFNDTYIYIGAFCKDTASKKGVRVQDFRRDFNNFK